MYAQTIARSCIRPSPALISRINPPRAFGRYSSSSSDSKIGGVHFDQTKKNNDPDEHHTEEHRENSKYAEMDESGVHPAKELDPVKAPSRSTGFETKGQQGKDAGTGEDKGAHTENREKPGPNMTWGNK